MAGNFQQMGNAGGNQMMMQQSQAASQVQQNAIQNVLLQNIQSQPGALSGWQANIPVNDRLGQVWHIVTQLRLANSNSGQQDLQKICGLALNFEKGAFDSASDRDSYLKLLHDKLEQLTAARNQMTMNAQAALQAQAQAQAHAQQMGMVNQGGMPGQMARPNMGQPQPQQGFQHLQHQMQASPLPGQQQPQQVNMGMGNNMLAQNMAQTQQQFQMPMQQQSQQPQPGINNRTQGGQAQMTPQEQAMVVELTNRLMAAASDEDKNNIRMNMQGRMDQATLMRYQTQGVDPLVLYYRNQAVTRLRLEKQRHAQLANQQPGQGMPMGVKRPQGAVPMQQQRSGNPNPMAGQGQQPQQMLGNSDFGFVGAVDNIQQQNGTLPQEAGQMGVPPNLPQGNTTPQTIAGLPAQAVTPNTQRVSQNPNLRVQQQFNTQQAQQERMNQAATQAQAQARAKVQAQQMALHGQPGGMGPMPPAQSPAMNTLNAPLIRAPQQNPSGDVQQMNQQGASHFGQPLDPRFAALNQRAGMNGGQNNIMFPPGMTPEQRQKLMTLPPDKLNEVIGKWNERLINSGQQVRPTGPMPGNGQMVRPNQAIPPAALNQQNMVNQMAGQFMPNGQPIQRPPQSMIAGINPQQQMLLQQQMANRMAQQQGQGRNLPQGPMGAADLTAINQIDHVDFPPQALGTIPRQVPPEIKKWGQLKAWVAQNLGNMPQILEQLKHMQRMHYQNLLRARMTQRIQQQNGSVNQSGGGQPEGLGIMNPAMAAPVAPMGQPQLQQPAQMPTNMANIPHVSPQDIQKARAHPSGRWAAMSDDEIKTMIIKNTLMQRQRQNLAQFQQQQQHMAQMGQMGPQTAMQRPPGIQQPQAQQGPTPGGKMGRAQPGQPVVPQARPQQPQTAADLKQPPTAPARGSKPGQPTSSPAQPPKNLKRASSDEVVEVPNLNVPQQNKLSMQQQLNQQQRPGQPQPPRPNLTPEQIAALTPDQKKQYFQALQRFQQSKQQQQVGPQPTPEDMHKFQSIRQDEISKFRHLPDIPMDQETKQAVANKLITTAPKLNNVFKVAPRWFVISHDENRLRLFFRTQIRVSQQFEDPAMQKTKQSFSMGLKDVDEALNIAQNMIADVLAKYPNLSRSQAAPGPVGGQPQAAGAAPQAPMPQTMPLNAANLQQQQQALAKQQQNKMHARSTSKSHTPAAPTTAQPPFAISSPQGVPMYGQPQIDPGQLRIPPAKKRKNANITTPILPQKAAPAPAGTQEMRLDQQGQALEVKQGPKVWPCPEVDCDHYYNDPFASEQELAKHKQEEHVKPLQDPAKFMMGELAQMLGLEENGTEKKAEKSGTAADAKTEIQGQALAAIPMKAQRSSTGKPSPAVSTKQAKPSDGKQAVGTAKQGTDSKEGQPQPPKTEQATQDLWANSSVNPQDLVHNFQKFETGAGGAISNMDVYRSITPNDTPESSKDGLSEPNSDITEGADLNIDLQFGEFDRNWMPFGPSDADDLLGFGDITVSGADDAVMVDSDVLPTNEAWDQFIDFSAPDKPFAFDTSFFSMNEQAIQ